MGDGSNLQMHAAQLLRRLGITPVSPRFHSCTPLQQVALCLFFIAAAFRPLNEPAT